MLERFLIDAETPLTLDYASPAARWGITVQRHPGGVRVIVPSTHSRSFFTILGMMAVPLVACLAAGFLFASRQSAYFLFNPELAICAIWGGSTLAGSLVATVVRSWNRLLLDITREEVAVASISGSGRGVRASWPRKEIGDIKLNPPWV
jgi:hypothetical protein